MTRRLILLPTLFLLVILSSTLLSAHAEQPDAQLQPEAGATSLTPHLNYAPDRMLVEFRATTGPLAQIDGVWQTGHASLDRLLSTNGIQSARPLFAGAASEAALRAAGLDQIYLLHFAPGRSVAEAAQTLALDPGVEWAEPDYLAYPIDTTPNDPLFVEQWGLTTIQAPAAWDVVTGTSTVAIAIVDSGIDFSHPDLASKLWVNPGEIAANSIDDDNNGHIDDINGWDFVNADADPSDDYGHGTQVAGIAAAATDNSTGIAGVCWACKVMPVKVMQSSGVANYSDIAQGVLYAAQKGARVINLSLGGYSYSSALHAAVQAAADSYGAVVVGGAGNDGVSIPFYPGAFPEVLAVAGTDESDVKALASNFGAWVDVSAPAVAITATFAGGDWGSVEGTSFATAFVSGVAGLVRSLEPGWSPALVRAQLVNTADPIDALNPDYEGLLGSGRPNALAAVTQTPSPLLQIAATAVNGDPLGRPVPGESATLEVTLGNDWLDASGVVGTLTTSDPYVTISQDNAAFGDIAAGSTGTASPLFTFDVALDAGYNYPIAFVLQVTANGGAFTGSLPLTITTRSAEEPVGGTIVADTIWTSDKRYIVSSNVGVAPGVTLTIEAGTEVRFDGNYNLNVGGKLVADGTAQKPIRFLSNGGADWGTIYFDDTTPDAQVDANYDYMAGSILRHARIKDTAGIVCNNATPYLSFVDLNGGVGIDCTAGTLTVGAQPQSQTAIVLDSRIEAYSVPCGIIVQGGAYLQGTEVAGDSLVDISGPSTVVDNLIHGGIRVGSDSFVHQNRAANIVAGANSVTQENVVSSIQTGPHSQVLSNTVASGSITVGDHSEVRANRVESAGTWAIKSSEVVTATANRVVGGGIQIGGGLVQGNLIANSIGTGLEINGNTTVISNSITGSAGTAIKILSATSLTITHNNLEGNTGQYDTENRVLGTTLASISAHGNWWGTTDPNLISQRIFDYYDDYNVGKVLFSPPASGPMEDAPAYVRSVTLTPESPVGIETVTFDVLFSREMVQSTHPTMSFTATEKDTWQTYNTSNSGLAWDGVTAMALDAAGNKWFGMCGGFWGEDGGVSVLYADGTWQTYDTSNSGLANNCIRAIALDATGNKWFGGTNGVSFLSADGNWQTYIINEDVEAIALDEVGNKWFGTSHGVHVLQPGDTWQIYTGTNSGLADDNVQGIAVDTMGNKWFGTWGGGVSVLRADNTWQTYNSTNSGLADNWVFPMMLDAAENKWFGTMGGASVLLADGSWQTYSTANSGLAHDEVYAIAFDREGSEWFGTWGGGASVLHADGTWQTYNTGNSELANDNLRALVVDTKENKWFGTSGGGVSLLKGGAEDFVVDNPQWPAPTLYRATYDVNSLIPRDTYFITVQGAVGSDDITIAPNSAYAFTVDYAGAVGDTTPPPAPSVETCASTSVDTLSASWSAFDPDSAITLYRYAIGTTPGGTDVINWINTPDMSFLRTGLGLIGGQTYFVAVKARNEGGLWSEPGIPAGVIAGSGMCTTNQHTVYLPLVMRHY